ncbi:unnamed protein product, partial [Iphiclides podalirius]
MTRRCNSAPVVVCAHTRLCLMNGARLGLPTLAPEVTAFGVTAVTTSTTCGNDTKRRGAGPSYASAGPPIAALSRAGRFAERTHTEPRNPSGTSNCAGVQCGPPLGPCIDNALGITISTHQ